MIEDIKELIRIPSILSDKSSEGKPFGEEVARCLDKLLEIGDKLGFKVKNYDGYVGEMDMGEGDDIIGILCHCDVVSAGEGWLTDPFEPVIRDGNLYGRGSVDDKGPLVACMYAVKKLKDEKKIPANVTVRIIVGTNEEEDWNDIPYYLERAESLPKYSIVPDGQFPVIYCEKGLYDIDLFYEHNGSSCFDIKMEDFRSGSARNAVAAKAEVILAIRPDCIVEVASQLEKIIEDKKYKAHISIKENRITLVTEGKNAHAMNPEKGINAGSQMIDILNEISGYTFSHEIFVKEFCKLIGNDYLGEQAGIACEDKESGKLTVNVGRFEEQNNGDINMQVSIRYPASCKFEDIKEKVLSKLGTGILCVKEISHMKPVHFKKDDRFIQLLMQIYKKATGDMESLPVSIGGATYARAIPNAVAFGPVMPWQEEMAHEPNEFISIALLYEIEKIYYMTVEKMCEYFSLNGGDNF